MKYIIFIVCLLNSFSLLSQNLVVDGGFETLENLTNQKGHWYGTIGSPDLWDTSGFCATPALRGMNFELQRSAHGGKKYIGLCYTESCLEEALSGVLSEPLKKDTIYEIAMYVKSADKVSAGTACLDYNKLKEFYITFSINDFNWEKQAYLPLPYLSLSSSDKQLVNNKWLRITAFYKARGGENRIILGGFKRISIYGKSNCETYYYFDDVVVQ